ncbi:MAG: HEAT repeat domain-containing protein [Pyrinomonadaceae bacterium]
MKISTLSKKIMGNLFAVFLGFSNVLAQMPAVRAPRAQPEIPPEDFTWWYITLFILVLALAAAIGWMYKRKSEAAVISEKRTDALDWDDSLDAKKELEWFKTISKSPSKKKTSKFPKGLPQTSKVLSKQTAKTPQPSDLELKERRRKMEKIAFEKLPIRGIRELENAPFIEPLPMSDDQGLLSAIEQAQDEYEEDPQVRELALRVLAKFKTQNSIEALSQIAMYDLSSNIRSSAVAALADFDHESVFEAILLACADPTREVRAAAARSLFRLSFSRAEAWTRIAECGDEFRVVQAARAAIESELVDRSINRLVDDDHGHAYEAFALVALLVKAGETKEIFEVIENQSDRKVKLAILHCLKVLKDPSTLPDLYTYIERNSLPEDLSNAANDVIRSFDMVPA